MKYKNLFNIGLSLLLFIFNNLLVTTILFIFKTSITSLNILISSLITIIEVILLMKYEKNTLKETSIVLLTFILIVAGSIFTSGIIYDVSYDSNTYHKVSIGLLKNGWNPVYETIDEFNNSDRNNLKQLNTFAIWNDHYARGYHIYAANVYSLTNNIETGKSIYPIIIISTFFITFAFLTSFNLNKIFTFFISMLLAFNPVTIYQLGSFYNDGLLGNLLLILLISLTLITFKKDLINTRLSYLLYFLTLVILINIKFTGLAYGGLYSLIYYIYIIINKKERKENLKKLTLAGLLSLIFGVCLIGLSTYFYNYKNNGNPFYPLYGEKSVDIMTGNTPTGLDKMNRVKRFIYANFSETYNKVNNGEKLYKLKIPFTFKIKELKYFINTDTRVGGYGVLFGGILLIMIILLIYDIRKGKNKIYYLIPTLTTISLIFILKDTWWARYLPQLYFISILSIILFNITCEKIKTKKIINILFTSILILNSSLIAGPSFLSLIKEKINIEEEFKTLNKIEEEKELLVIGTEFSGATYNLYDKHKNIKIINSLENKEEYKEKTYMGGRVCLPTYERSKK